MVAIYILIGFFALVGLVCFVLLFVFLTESIAETIEQENYKSPYLPEEYNEEIKPNTQDHE